MANDNFDLVAAARQEMIDRGFEPDFPPAAERQLQSIAPSLDRTLRDLTGLLWSSIDNDDSRDLDQIEWAERAAAGIRVLVGIADVDSLVPKDTPIDAHAACETTTVYAGVHTFPMLPERLSTDLTSLAEGQDRAAVVIEMVVAADGSIASSAIYRARVRNHAQLTYSDVGSWLEGTAPAPAKVAASPELAAQLKLQDQAAGQLREARHRLGALTFDRLEVQPVFADGQVKDMTARAANRASRLIEDFMIGANEVMAETLRKAGVSSIRRIVKEPERWPRIVELAAQHGDKLPPTPDAFALNAFLMRRKQADPVHYPDLSLSVLKLMGPGEYVVLRPGEAAKPAVADSETISVQDLAAKLAVKPALLMAKLMGRGIFAAADQTLDAKLANQVAADFAAPSADQGHFGLAAHDYTHSTAPNRRFADMVTQRLVKAHLAGNPSGYADADLDAIARNCTLKEDAARKVQRDMTKRMAAVALRHRIGETFSAVVTGAVPKGVFVRIFDPPVEGRLMRGEHGLDVGDRLRVTLLATDPQRGFLDFGRA